jgi:protocatechuate 3,4-dioxygenase beta subunit
VAVAVAATAGVLGTVEPARATAKVADAPQALAKKAEAVAELNSPIPAEAVTPVQPPPDAIEIIVRAKETGQPIANASVRTTIDLVHSTRKADAEGRIKVDLSNRRFGDTFNFDVWAEGYVQQRHFFAEKDSRYPKLPGQFVVELYPGEQTLGGKVTDEHGRPVDGVTVEVWGYLGSKKQKDELAYMVDAATDDKGEWRCRCFRGMTFANLYLSHPDYLADDAFHARRHGSPTPSSQPQPGDKPLEALRDFSDVQVMERGVEISGEVLDEQGKPVPGAEVGWLQETARDTFHHDLPTTATDERGRFRFPHVRPGKLVLQVTSLGHAPALSRVEGRPGGEPTTIKLGPRKALAGRVVDSQGKPIAGASVHIDSWRGYRALGVFLKTDAEGRFRWDDAPADLVLLNADRAGFNSVIQQRVTPDDGEVLMTLRRSLSISGRIADAETNKNIDRAQIEVGIVDAATGKMGLAGGQPGLRDARPPTGEPRRRAFERVPLAHQGKRVSTVRVAGVSERRGTSEPGRQTRESSRPAGRCPLGKRPPTRRRSARRRRGGRHLSPSLDSHGGQTG